MTTPRKFKSDAFEAIHSAATAMQRNGVIGKTTMREYDALCIKEAPNFDALAIRQLRDTNNLSQPVFASYLNVSRSTVEKWESGDKRPNGAALRLLSVVSRHGLKVLG